jgi:hypothetical protein
MALVKLDWYRRTVSDKLLKTEYIIQQMTANVATYATPNPDLADVEAARLNLNKAAVTALAGGVALTLAKNEAEDVLDELITQLIPYVQNVSGGIEALILKGGMEVRKSSSPIPTPERVQNLDAFPSRYAKEIDLNWDGLGRNFFYQIEMFVDDDKGGGQWVKLATTSRSKYLVNGLITGTVYRFRVAGIGRNDEIGPYSQEATSVAP